MAPEACPAGGYPCCVILMMVCDIPKCLLLLTFSVNCYVIKALHFGSWLCFLPQVQTCVVNHFRKAVL